MKKLNSLDPPVTAMELICVRMVCCYPPVCSRNRTQVRRMIGHHLVVLRIIYVRTSTGLAGSKLTTKCSRYITKVPDPFLGPKGVRLLLAFRGFFGCVSVKVGDSSDSNAYEFLQFLWLVWYILLSSISFTVGCNRPHFPRAHVRYCGWCPVSQRVALLEASWGWMYV